MLATLSSGRTAAASVFFISSSRCASDEVKCGLHLKSWHMCTAACFFEDCFVPFAYVSVDEAGRAAGVPNPPAASVTKRSGLVIVCGLLA